MIDDSEIEFTIGNTDLRITTDGKIQIKTKKGVALLEKGFKVKRGSEMVELEHAITTSSTTWVDVTGLNPHKLQSMLGKKESNIIVKAIPSLKKNKNFLKKLVENFPLEIESLIINFGFFKARFRRKKK